MNLRFHLPRGEEKEDWTPAPLDTPDANEDVFVERMELDEEAKEAIPKDKARS